MWTCFVCKMERGQSGKTNAKCFILLKPKRLASIAYIQISLKKNEGSKWPQNNELRITSANRDLFSCTCISYINIYSNLQILNKEDLKID